MALEILDGDFSTITWEDGRPECVPFIISMNRDEKSLSGQPTQGCTSTTRTGTSKENKVSASPDPADEAFTYSFVELSRALLNPPSQIFGNNRNFLLSVRVPQTKHMRSSDCFLAGT
ncbi:no significant blast hit [Histoplasma capsulatum]|uniref:No significant blast hit n=1 Tax=Ajellomyces capsulatus TaxID=5037 RepID=A0A8A1MJZ4_AJECA|nr:no significant blast hit [Histoplasma capsulatum]